MIRSTTVNKESKQSKKQNKLENAPTYGGLGFFKAMAIIDAGLLLLFHPTKQVHLIAPKTGFYYFMYQYFGKGLGDLLATMTKFMGPAMAMLVLCLAFELVITPLSCYSIYISEQRRLKLGQVAPQLALINKYENTHSLTDDQMERLGKIKQAIIKVNNIKNITFVTWLIIGFDIVFFVPLYQSVAYSPIGKMMILGVKLSERSIPILVIATVFSFLSSAASILAASSTNRKQMTYMLWTSPLIVFTGGLFMPAIIPFYETTTSAFSILRSLLSYWVIKPLAAKRIAKPVILIENDDSIKWLMAKKKGSEAKN